MKPGPTDFDGEIWPVTKLVLSLAFWGANVKFYSPHVLTTRSDLGGIMTKLIDRVRDAVVALVEVIAGATMPQPKLIPIKVVAGKSRR